MRRFLQYNHCDDDDDDDNSCIFVLRSRQSDLNRKILLTAIISLSIVLVLVISLHLYARWVLRRQALRRAAIHQISLAVARAHDHANSIDPPNTGLDPTLRAALPILLFKRKERTPQNDDDSSAVECAVCLSALENDELVRLLPNCNHTFHVSCIDTWLDSHSTCPVCRTKAEPRLEPHPRESPVAAAPPPAHADPPPLEQQPTEGTSDMESPKFNGSNSRLSSFRRNILSTERPSRRIRPSSQDDHNAAIHDLERQ